MESIPTLLEELLCEKDETLCLLEESKKIEHRHQEILALSSDLEDAYRKLLEKVK